MNSYKFYILFIGTSVILLEYSSKQPSYHEILHDCVYKMLCKIWSSNRTIFIYKNICIVQIGYLYAGLVASYKSEPVTFQ